MKFGYRKAYTKKENTIWKKEDDKIIRHQNGKIKEDNMGLPVLYLLCCLHNFDGIYTHEMVIITHWTDYSFTPHIYLFIFI